MPFIEQIELPKLAVFSGKTEMTATGTVERTGALDIAGGTTMTVAGSVLLQASVLFAGSTEVIPQGRLNDEPNHFGAVEFAGKTEMIASGSLAVGGFVRMQGATAMAVTGSIAAPETAVLTLIVDVIAAASASSNYQDYGVRLTVGGVIVKVSSWDVNKSETAANKTLAATITRFSDRTLFTAGAVITFEIEMGDGAGWQTEFSGKVSSKNFQIQNENGRPNDVFSFSCSDETARRLNFSPLKNLVIHDSARAEISEEDFEPVYDTAGRPFGLEAVPVAGLMLYTLFTKIFVERCGFGSVKANLPNYPIRQANFDVSGSYLEGVSPHIGMFEPLVFDKETELWIVDATNVLPAGFPAPVVLEASRIDGYQSGQTFERIDGFTLQSAESELGEYFTRRTDPDETIVGSPGDADFSRTVKATTVKEYRLASQPAVVIGEVIEKEVFSVYDNTSAFPIDETVETFAYDNFGRQKSSTRVVKRYVPNLPGGTTSSLQTVETETLSIKYGVNPFFPRKQIQKSSERRVSGLIALNTAKPFLGRPFPQDFIKALEAGNLKPEMATINGVKRTVVEKFRPLRNGQVKSESVTTDFVPASVGRKPIVTNSVGEPRSGDVSLPGTGGRRIQRHVFATDNYTRTSAAMENFGVGELPLQYAIPLARRKLLRKTDLNQKISANIIGLSRMIREGAVLAVYDREANVLAKMIVEGWQKHGDENKTYTIVRGRQV